MFDLFMGPMLLPPMLGPLLGPGPILIGPLFGPGPMLLGPLFGPGPMLFIPLFGLGPMFGPLFAPNILEYGPTAAILTLLANGLTMPAPPLIARRLLMETGAATAAPFTPLSLFTAGAEPAAADAALLVASFCKIKD